MNVMILEVGDVVQLSPQSKYPGMLLVVTEPKGSGCQGFLLSQLNFEAVRFRGVAYYRAKWEEMEYIGKLKWNLQPSEDTIVQS